MCEDQRAMKGDFFSAISPTHGTQTSPRHPKLYTHILHLYPPKKITWYFRQEHLSKLSWIAISHSRRCHTFCEKKRRKEGNFCRFFSGNHHCLLWGTVKTPTLLFVPPGSFLIFWLPQQCYRWGLVRSHAFFALGCRWRMLIDDTKNHLTFLKAVTRCDCFNERNWKVHFWAVVCPSFSQSSFWEDSVHSPLSASTQTNGSRFAHYPLPAEMTPSFNHNSSENWWKSLSSLSTLPAGTPTV